MQAVGETSSTVLTLGLHGLSEASRGRGHEGGDAARAGETRCSEQHCELLERRDVAMEENWDEERSLETFTLARLSPVRFAAVHTLASVPF